MLFGLIPKDGAYSVLNTTRTVASKATSEQLTNAGPLVLENLPTTPGDNILSVNSSTGVVSRTLFPSNLPAGTTFGQYLYYSPDAGQFVVGGDKISLGNNAGIDSQGQGAVALGARSGNSAQGTFAIAIGDSAGEQSQAVESIAIGFRAGQESQQENAISIGFQAGQIDQGISTVAIGYQSGVENQGNNSVAIGPNSAKTNQAPDCVSIGVSAGNLNQGTQAVTIGANAGQNNQGTRSIAIGSSAGFQSQGSDCIAIGVLAGANSQDTNTIILNATGVALESVASNGFYVSPVREVAGGVALLWNAATGEVSIAPSRRETKNTIIDIADDTSVVFGLQARNFIYNTDENKEVQVGYIAEEVEELNPKLAIHNVVGGPPVNINYNAVLVFLVEEVRKLRARVDALSSAS